MFDYLTKFKNLPKEMQDAVSSPKATGIISGLEKKYGVDLASTTIKIIIKEVPWLGVETFLIREHHLTKEQAKALQKEMAQELFFNLHQHLNIPNVSMLSKNSPSKEIKMTESKTINNWNEILKIASAQAKDNGQQERLKNTLNILQKGVRDKIDTIQTLIKPFSNGGMGLTKEQAEQIISLTGNKIEQQPKMTRPKTSLEKLNESRDMEYDLSQLEKKVNINNKTFQKPHKFSKQELEHELAPPAPALRKKDSLNNLNQPDFAPKKEEQNKIKTSAKNVFNKIKVIKNTISPVSKSSQTSSESIQTNNVDNFLSQENKKQELKNSIGSIVARTDPSKPQVNDITRPQLNSIQGPIDELANLDLTNFNRMGSDSKVVMNIIKSKIDLLEKESYTRRQQGVNAWRRSPVYQMYIQLGNESIISGKSIEQVIQEKINQGKIILAAEQFDMIGELNEKLKI